MQCRDIILEMAEEKKDQRQSSAVIESQHDACIDDCDQQAADSLAQDVEKLTIENTPKVDEPQSHQQQQPSTIVCDAWYGLPTQKRPRRERVNAIARQLRNVEQSALLATRTAESTSSSKQKHGCGVRVVLVGKESDVQVIGERLEKLREEDGGTNDESSCDSCRVELLPNVSVAEACGVLPAQEAEVDKPASANDDTETKCHGKPIYLSPDADTTLDPRKPPPRTVVVGMLIDRRVQPNRSSERAEKIDVPAARLPMDELKVEGLETNEALNVDTVLETMVCWWDNVDGLRDGGGYTGNNNDDDDGNSCRRCFIAAASAAMVSHEDRHPNRAIHGTGS